MKKLALIVLGLHCMAAGAVTPDIRQVLLSMPDTLMPLLSVSNRQDFLDYQENGMEGTVSNRWGGASSMPQFDEKSLTIRTSQAGFVQIGLFERRKGGSMICVVNTVNAGYKDSRIAFYDMEWNALPASDYIELPKFEDYLNPSVVRSDSLGVLQKASVLRMASIAIVTDGLAFTYSSKDYYPDKEDTARFARFFKDGPVLYRWTGKKFKKLH